MPFLSIKKRRDGRAATARSIQRDIIPPPVPLDQCLASFLKSHESPKIREKAQYFQNLRIRQVV
jgi:hypothetical protein